VVPASCSNPSGGCRAALRMNIDAESIWCVSRLVEPSGFHSVRHLAGFDLSEPIRSSEVPVPSSVAHVLALAIAAASSLNAARRRESSAFGTAAIISPMRRVKATARPYSTWLGGLGDPPARTITPVGDPALATGKTVTWQAVVDRANLGKVPEAGAS